VDSCTRSALRPFAITAAVVLVLTAWSAAAGAELPPSSEAPLPHMAAIEVVLEIPVTTDLDGGGNLLRLAIAVELSVNSESPLSAPSFTAGLSAVYETNPNVRYVFLNGLRVAKVPYSGSTEYYAYDALGNVRVILSSSGGRISTLAYRPFGVCAYSCVDERPYGYTGEYREGSPNLIYLHSRWYDPTIGRFLSPDDRLGSLALPQDQNRYAYVVNNPMAYTDPTGHIAPLVLLGVLLALGIISGTALTTYAWYVNRASGEERAGFWSGVVAGLLVGIAMGFLLAAACGATAGAACVFFAIMAASMMGSVVAAATYAMVTGWLGGEATGGRAARA